MTANKQAEAAAEKPEYPEERDGRIGDREVAVYVQRIADRLARAAGEKPLEVRITRASRWYADLQPENVLFISGGLAQRVENEAELAGLIAHELAHASAAAPAQGQPAPAAKPSTCVLALPSVPASRIEEQRQAEISATQAAMKTLRSSGYEPSAILDLLSKLAYEKPEWATAILAEDLLRLRTAFESQPIPVGGYIQDSSEFSGIRERLTAALARPPAKKAPPAPPGIPR